MEALKILQESYLGKIKCIYIDPPYNTGKDFIYRDSFSKDSKEELENGGEIDEDGNKLVSNPESNGRFHSDWLSMMYPRLKLARNLLSDDGVIFISIDDNEQANLKKLCDEVFGEDNFVSCLHIELSLTQGMKVGAAQKGTIVKNGEFILVYSKNRMTFKLEKLLYDGIKGYDKHFSLILENNKIISMGESMAKNGLFAEFLKKNNMKPSFGSFCEMMEKDENFRQFIYENFSDKIFQSMMAKISIPEEIREKIKSGEVVKYDKYLLHMVQSGKVRQLLPLSETLGMSDDYSSCFGRRRIRGDMWKGFYSDMMNLSKEGDINFKNGKKPVRLIRQLLKWVSRPDDIILDFFSGSATTAHAVMQLNAEDNGNRKFIMVQLPEKCDEKSEAYANGYKTICDIGEERIRRAGDKIKEENGMLADTMDFGFRVYRVDSSNIEDVYRKPADVVQGQLDMFERNIKQDRSSLDLLIQVMLDLGLTLDMKIEEREIKGHEVYFVAYNSLVACFDNNIDMDIIDEICERKPLKVVFKDSSFENDSDKINLEEKIKKLSKETEVNVV